MPYTTFFTGQPFTPKELFAFCDDNTTVSNQEFTITPDQLDTCINSLREHSPTPEELSSQDRSFVNYNYLINFMFGLRAARMTIGVKEDYSVWELLLAYPDDSSYLDIAASLLVNNIEDLTSDKIIETLNAAEQAGRKLRHAIFSALANQCVRLYSLSTLPQDKPFDAFEALLPYLLRYSAGSIDELHAAIPLAFTKCPPESVLTLTVYNLFQALQLVNEDNDQTAAEVIIDYLTDPNNELNKHFPTDLLSYTVLSHDQAVSLMLARHVQQAEGEGDDEDSREVNRLSLHDQWQAAHPNELLAALRNCHESQVERLQIHINTHITNVASLNQLINALPEDAPYLDVKHLMAAPDEQKYRTLIHNADCICTLLTGLSSEKTQAVLDALPPGLMNRLINRSHSLHSALLGLEAHQAEILLNQIKGILPNIVSYPFVNDPLEDNPLDDDIIAEVNKALETSRKYTYSFFNRAPVMVGTLEEQLDKYIGDRLDRGTFHWDFLWLGQLQQLISKTWHAIRGLEFTPHEKSQAAKTDAASTLRGMVNGNVEPDKSSFEDTSIKALEQGLLGDIVAGAGGLNQIIEEAQAKWGETHPGYAAGVR